MTTILVDSKYVANALRHGRRASGIRIGVASKIFGMSAREYQRIEHGKTLAPSNMMGRLMILAFQQLCTRRVAGAHSLSPLKIDPDRVVIMPSDVE